MSETRRWRRSHPIVVAQAVLLAFALTAEPIVQVALATAPGRSSVEAPGRSSVEAPGRSSVEASSRSSVEASSHRDVREILRGPLRRLAAGRLSQSEQRKLLRGTVTGGPAARPEVAVTVHFDETVTAPMIAEVASTGARVANVGSQAVEAYVSPDRLVALAQVAGVRSIRPILANRPSGYVSPAVALHGANTWQTAGYTGSSIKVGIIDTGFAGLAARLGTELPVTVRARCYTAVGAFTADLSSCDNGDTHGTAVAETVFDMAPGIELYIAKPISSLDVQATAAWMTANGVRIINASTASSLIFEGPGDGTSPSSASFYVAVDQATAAGALWVNAAGNEGDAGWTGAWTDANADGWLEFANGDLNNSVTLAAGDDITVAIRWADPWGASSNDYDLVLYSGSTLVGGSYDYQAGAGDPFEILSYVAPTAGTYDISIYRVSGAATPRMQLLVSGLPIGQSLQHRVAAGTLPSPADSSNPGMVTVGAVNFETPGTIEPYSSRGPTLDGRVKPDLVAADCAPTTINPEFCGTSESAPFVAGAAAQVLQAYPTLTPSQLAVRLRSHAVPLGTPVPNSTFGWGRLNLGPVPVAIDRIAPTVTLTAPATPTKATTLPYTVAFSEPVTGLAAGDFTRTGTATGCIVGASSVVTSTSYGVALTGCSAGTVILALRASTVADLVGNPGPASTVTATTVTIDRIAPTTRSLAARPRTGAALSGTSVPLALAWSGSDNTGGSGIARHELALSRNGGAWTTVAASLTTKSTSVTAASSGTVQYRVRAVDKAGNSGAWAYSRTLSPRLVQQSSTAVRYSGTWRTTVWSASYSGGTAKYAKVAGRSASYTFTGRSIAFVTTKATNRGKVKVYVNGGYVATVDLYRSSIQYRALVWQKTWSTSGTRTVKFVVAGTSGRPRVDLDAIVVVK